jgi:GntR family transcriptional regulator
MESQIPIRPGSLAQQVLQILVDRIRQGVYPPGSQLPPENQLSAEFNVSRATVRSAIEALAGRRLVVRRQGIGTFVSRLSGLKNPLNEAMDFAEWIAAAGYQPGYDFVRIALVVPDTHVADALDIPPGGEVLQSYKVFTADGEPVIYAINHIPVAVLGAELARQAVADPTITEPLFDFLEQRCGQCAEYSIASVRAELGQNCAFPGLDDRSGVPVLLLEEVACNAGETPIWHSFEFYPGNLISFDLVRQRGSFSRSARRNTPR